MNIIILALIAALQKEVVLLESELPATSTVQIIATSSMPFASVSQNTSTPTSTAIVNPRRYGISYCDFQGHCTPKIYAKIGSLAQYQ